MVLRGQDLWRAAPIFKFGFTDVVPGFREGAVLFGLFSAYEFMSAKASGAKHGHGHESAHGAHGGSPAAAAHGHGAKSTGKQLH
jgi:hypothetical protein